MLKPCIDCGTPSTSSRCPEHRRAHRARQVGSARARGYDRQWDKLSTRLRKLSPLCEQCGSTEDLQLDHKPSAWLRKAAGKPIRPQDVRVLCRLCNVAAGKARPDTHGSTGNDEAPGLRGKPQSPSLSGVPLDGGSDETQDVERSLPGDALVVEHHQLTDQQHVGQGHDHVVVREAVAEGGSEEPLVEYARPRLTTEEGRHQLDSLYESSIEFRVHDWTLS